MAQSQIVRTLESVARMRNVEMFLTLEDHATVKSAALSAGIAHQHGTRLIRKWRNAGWIVRKPSLHGKRYFYTDAGLVIRDILLPLYDYLEQSK